MTEDVKVIKRSLRREPRQLPSCIWDPLNKFQIIWTPQEEQRHLLRSAPGANFIPSEYASGVLQGLHAASALDERTQELKLSLKSGNEADLDLLVDNSDLLIHERCFDFDACHARSPCQISGLAATDPYPKDYNHELFLCDHVVIYLYGLLLD
jgi:hypothetical protein